MALFYTDIDGEELDSPDNLKDLPPLHLLGKPRFKTVAEGEGRLDRGVLELELLGSPYGDGANQQGSLNTGANPNAKPKEGKKLFKLSCIPAIAIFVVIFIFVFFPLLSQRDGQSLAAKTTKCSKSCEISLVESIPLGMEYPNFTANPSIFSSWVNLISAAEHSIDIASFYWSLRGDDIVPDPSDWQGEEVFNRLKDAGLKRGIKIRIAQSEPSPLSKDEDTKLLADSGAAEVRSLDFNRLVGAGVLHTKLWIVDKKHFFVGSANMDWRSLTQVKELGAVVYNCPCMAEDVMKIFEVYWSLGLPNATIPAKWPAGLSTNINSDTPMKIAFNGTPAQTYLSSSPPQLCPEGRTSDLNAILDTISSAERFVYIAVMDYVPAMLYTVHHQFWPVLDDRIRQMALEKSIRVRLLASHWNHTPTAMGPFLRSLRDISRAYPHVDIQVKLFVVPSTPSQEKIPFARVNHNKYMVTDKTAYIGTSNWSGDYFINTGGVGLVVSDSAADPKSNSTVSLRQQLVKVFQRDWNSQYAVPLDFLASSL